MLTTSRSAGVRGKRPFTRLASCAASAPCATCVDEVTGKRIVGEAALPILVYPTKIEPVGRYAIQIFWSDGHSTGIYTWERLYDLLPQARKLQKSSPPAT